MALETTQTDTPTFESGAPTPRGELYPSPAGGLRGRPPAAVEQAELVEPIVYDDIDPVLLVRLYPEAIETSAAADMALEAGRQARDDGLKLRASQQEPVMTPDREDFTAPPVVNGDVSGLPARDASRQPPQASQQPAQPATRPGQPPQASQLPAEPPRPGVPRPDQDLPDRSRPEHPQPTQQPADQNDHERQERERQQRQQREQEERERQVRAQRDRDNQDRERREREQHDHDQQERDKTPGREA